MRKCWPARAVGREPLCPVCHRSAVTSRPSYPAQLQRTGCWLARKLAPERATTQMENEESSLNFSTLEDGRPVIAYCNACGQRFEAEPEAGGILTI